MKVCIPKIGNQLQLISSWEPTIQDDYRNSTLFEFLDIPGYEPTRWMNIMPPRKILFPAGEVLKIERLMVNRTGSDLVTFSWSGKYAEARVNTLPNGSLDRWPKRKVRFFASLEDVNKIEFELA